VLAKVKCDKKQFFPDEIATITFFNHSVATFTLLNTSYKRDLENHLN
jgi:hypothetical protein